MVHDDVIAKAAAPLCLSIIETVNHRQAVALAVSQACRNQFTRAAKTRRRAVFDDMALYRRLLNHIGKVHLVHVHHPACGMALFQITAQQCELFTCGPWPARAHLQIFVAPQNSALRCIGFKLVGQYPHRNARLAIKAAGPIRDILAAAKANPTQSIIQLTGVRAIKLGKNFTLRFARQIGARSRIRNEKSGKFYWCAHNLPCMDALSRIFILMIVMHAEYADEKRVYHQNEGLDDRGINGQFNSTRSTLYFAFFRPSTNPCN